MINILIGLGVLAAIISVMTQDRFCRWIGSDNLTWLGIILIMVIQMFLFALAVFCYGLGATINSL